MYPYTSVSVSTKAIPSSSNCFCSTLVGASVIRQDASFTFGKAMTSRILSSCLPFHSQACPRNPMPYQAHAPLCPRPRFRPSARLSPPGAPSCLPRCLRSRFRPDSRLSSPLPLSRYCHILPRLYAVSSPARRKQNPTRPGASNFRTSKETPRSRDPPSS